jgi:ABC-type multidrug transport system ATPase subunit
MQRAPLGRTCIIATGTDESVWSHLSCRHVKIGNPLEKGISGGQAKRTNIGIALITNPRVLFLDEPTSGLDSFTANEVMTVVQGLVADGVTIVATIHSPTAYAFSLFDSLMMLVSEHRSFLLV